MQLTLILQILELKTNLANQKTGVDPGKLVPVPVDFSKLSDVVKIDIV